jgi:Mrp family chromosome partitioning ATPase
MTEVNQAYLRAYLKNRLAQSQTNAPSPPVQAVPSSESLRLDPSHAHANLVQNQSYAAPFDQPPFSDLPVSVPPAIPPQRNPRPGIWTPHGVERGMKAMEPMSLPAVVQNGVAAVTSEAAQFRRPTSTPPQHTLRAEVPSPHESVPLNHSAHLNATNQYDQVMYVDGLGGHSGLHPTSISRPTERTLAAITEPIAFGTGLAPAFPNANRVFVQDSTLAQPATKGGRTGSAPRPSVVPTATPVKHRIDPPHRSTRVAPVKPMVSVELPPASPPSQPSLETPTAKPPVSLPTPATFAPIWEVDSFLWPEVVKRIAESQSDAFHQIGKQLRLANNDGLKVMAITSGERGVGRSTVAMHMARCAASRGLRVALIDGDTSCPSLIDQLRLDIEHGWQDCLFENVLLHEVAIHSINDGITLFPLSRVISHKEVQANLHRMAKLIKRISTEFDMVFIDANRLNLEQRNMVGVAQETIVDAAIVVVDTELSVKEKVDSAVSILQGMGLSSIGLVENFQSDATQRRKI